MGLEGQLHHIIIQSKPVMKSPYSSTPIKKNGSLKREILRGRERETDDIEVDKENKDI